MTFPEYAQGLRPFCSYGLKTEADFFTAMIDNFVKVAAMDGCVLLRHKPDTQYRYYTGAKAILPKNAQYLYDHRDLAQFEDWLNKKMDESESYSAVEDWLKEKGWKGEDPAWECASLLESIFLEIARQSGIADEKPKKNDVTLDLNLIKEIQDKIRLLPQPEEVPVPPDEVEKDQPYIEELLLAYGDAEQRLEFTRADLCEFPDYEDDLADRCVDYYAAETIRRGVLELKTDAFTGQFDVLKDEVLSGVKNTERSNRHANGYERMLAVMQEAVNAPITNYLLGTSPYWISAKIRQGVCHHLVNANKLRWVKRRGKT